MWRRIIDKEIVEVLDERFPKDITNIILEYSQARIEAPLIKKITHTYEERSTTYKVNNKMLLLLTNGHTTHSTFINSLYGMVENETLVRAAHQKFWNGNLLC